MSDHGERDMATEPVEGVDIAMEGDKVAALHGGEEVGRIHVPRLSLQWCRGTHVPMGGIGGVGTNERFRRRGIARMMMERAVTHARSLEYPCMGVSTGAANVARRLYSGAGCVYLFSMQGHARRPSSRRVQLPPSIEIREYETADEQAIMQLRCAAYGAFFGCQEPDARKWRNMRRGTLDVDTESVLVAVQGGTPVGYASYFQHWFGLACDICVGECRQRPQIGRALLRRLEQRLVARGCAQATFSATEDETFVRRLLAGERYHPVQPRVFQVNILDLGKLLSCLGPILATRISQSAQPGWTGTLTVRTDEGEGSVGLGVDPESSAITVTASQKTLTRVLCGRLSGWEAYLRGDLKVEADGDADTPNLLQAILPRVPCCHPIDEWW